MTIKAIGNYNLTGTITDREDGGFTVALEASPTSTPNPEPPDPPDNSITIKPSGGDDTGLIQDALEGLKDGQALVLSGMFSLGDTIWLDGTDKLLMGDPAVRSGLRSISDDQMVGHYGAMLCVAGGVRCDIRGLEFDGNNKQTELVFFDGGTDCAIEECYLHDIRHSPSGPPFAAIHSQTAVNLKVSSNKVERTGGENGREGVRGIWVPTRSGTVIEGNIVRDTGHTGIAMEGDGAIIRDNLVENIVVQGTAYKIHYRLVRKTRSARAAQPMTFEGNTARNTVGAGIMLEQCNAPAVVIEQCEFYNCGKQGTSFGAVYSTSPGSNVIVRNNRLDNCRSVGAFMRMTGAKLEHNIVTNGPAVLHLESDCKNIVLDNSGSVNVGPNCSNVFVDGQKVA